MSAISHCKRQARRDRSRRSGATVLPCSETLENTNSNLFVCPEEGQLGELFMETNIFGEALALRRLAEAQVLGQLEESEKRYQRRSTPVVSELSMHLLTVIQDLQAGLIERDTEVRLLLLAALAGEHILYLGPPGTAKSDLGRRLARIYDGHFFERLLTRFSVPEELFGPLSMRALEDDRYCRQTAGYLPEASVAFIDEVFKANSSILNTLLTIMNERLFDNGSKRLPIPLMCLVAASNELPENEELEALYDRFLLRRQVAQVSTAGLSTLLHQPGAGRTSSAAQPAAQNNLQDPIAKAGPPDAAFSEIRASAAKLVEIPEEVISMIIDVRQHMQTQMKPAIYVSDRRLLKAVRLLQVAAFTNGRTTVAPEDCLLLQHILWQRPDERQAIADFLLNQLAAAGDFKQAEFILKGLYGRAGELRMTLPKPDQAAARGESDAEGELQADVAALVNMSAAKVADVSGKLHAAYAKEALQGNIWISKEEKEATATAMIPRLELSLETAKSMLRRSLLLKVFLHDKTTTCQHLAFLLRPASNGGQLEAVTSS